MSKDSKAYSPIYKGEFEGHACSICHRLHGTIVIEKGKIILSMNGFGKKNPWQCANTALRKWLSRFLLTRKLQINKNILRGKDR